MTSRRSFLTRSGLALGALIVGDEVLELAERLAHRKVYALGGIPDSGVEWLTEKTMDDLGLQYLRVRTTAPGQYFYVNRRYLNAPILGINDYTFRANT